HGRLMGLICKLPQVIEEAKKEYEQIAGSNFMTEEEMGESENLLALGDNAAFMKHLLEGGMEGKIQQIYIDPPFFSKASYDAVIKVQSSDGETAVKHMAYEDVWKEGMAEYLKMLCVRLMLMKDLLSDTGTIWVHLDWHGVHYVKMLMDEIFGEKNFINEIVWTYKSGGSSKKHFARKHDTILVYSKTNKYYLNLPKEKSYNRGLKPYRFKGVEEFQDETGWYTMVNMKDVWSIDMVGRTSAERTGYATQKPEALLERIVAAGSREGDICADFFCGCGTLGAAAGKLGRRWICCDNGPLAVAAAMKRLSRQGQSMKVVRCLSDEYGEEKSPAELTASAYMMPTLFSDKICFTVELEAYELKEPDAAGNRAKETHEKLAKAAEDNPLAAIDFWSVDTDFDGKVFRPEREAALYRDKKGLRAEMKLEIPAADAARRKIAVRTVDILGNISCVIFDGGEIFEKSRE
ncbi:MAG: DNA methyltransferase, partial [Anaerovoracaceae bacterium]